MVWERLERRNVDPASSLFIARNTFETLKAGSSRSGRTSRTSRSPPGIEGHVEHDRPPSADHPWAHERGRISAEGAILAIKRHKRDGAVDSR